MNKYKYPVYPWDSEHAMMNRTPADRVEMGKQVFARRNPQHLRKRKSLMCKLRLHACTVESFPVCYHCGTVVHSRRIGAE